MKSILLLLFGSISKILCTVKKTNNILASLCKYFLSHCCSDPLWPHGLQHAKLPCPPLSPGFAQSHVHWVGDAIQQSHPLSFPSSPAFNLAQHQGLFQWVDSSHQVAKVLEFQLFHISPSNEYSRLISFRIDRFEKILSTANGVASGYFLVY